MDLGVPHSSHKTGTISFQTSSIPFPSVESDRLSFLLACMGHIMIYY